VQERVIVASRGIILLHIAGAAAGLIASAFATQVPISLSPNGRAQLGGAAGVLLFGGALAASVVRFVRPYRLTLTQNALVVERSFQQQRRIAWEDVDRFYVEADAKAPAIGFQYVRAMGLSSLALGSGAYGRDEVLPVGEFAMAPHDLAALLNECRTGGVAPVPTAEPASDPIVS